MAKIAVIGANGKAGSRILGEAKQRGHQVTAIVRDASKLAEKDTAYIEKDIFQLTTADLEGFDVVVNAFAAPIGQEEQYVEAGNVLIEALRSKPETRLFVVGGAGSLFVDEDQSLRLMDTPEFPDFVYPTASNAGKNLEALQAAEGLNWTYLSPSATFALGRRTGSYISGKDHVLVNSSGDSYVSYEDYAVAVVDEIEQPKHIRERFTVASEL
ncbi:hypothetical protein J41TS12_22200 [Paenibacillus antibioticophila]|uniref:NAD(P)-binding domain-containing protein n=1 Tax=Paenibacillus antibioticophila TaxID=1274374 RepID=A0A920CHN3_9BACL|nr:NAD(P)-dependent oxidoreductase [Paenibacillus antibioticophila]GIO37359.1 hypothetical protein J41TS12_22200 [Paenibacillus antibioticophila]